MSKKGKSVKSTFSVHAERKERKEKTISASSFFPLSHPPVSPPPPLPLLPPIPASPKPRREKSADFAFLLFLYIVCAGIRRRARGEEVRRRRGGRSSHCKFHARSPNAFFPFTFLSSPFLLPFFAPSFSPPPTTTFLFLISPAIPFLVRCGRENCPAHFAAPILEKIFGLPPPPSVPLPHIQKREKTYYIPSSASHTL